MILDSAKADNPTQSEQECDGFFEKTSEGCRSKGKDVIIYSDGFRFYVSDLIKNTNPSRIGVCDGQDVEVVQGVNAYYYHILGTSKVKIIPVETLPMLKRMDQLGKSVTANTEDIDNLTTAVNYISEMSQQTLTNDIRLNSIGYNSAGTKVADFDPDQAACHNCCNLVVI